MSGEQVEIAIIVCVAVIVLSIITFVIRELIKSVGIERFYRYIHKGLFWILLMSGYVAGVKDLGVLPSAGYGGLLGGLGFCIKSILNNPMTKKDLYKSLGLTFGCCIVSCISVSIGNMFSDEIGIYIILIAITLLMCLYQIIHYKRNINKNQ